MGAQLRSGPWAFTEPAPVFDASATVAAAAQQVEVGDPVSSGAGVEPALAAIEALQPKLNIFTSVFPEAAAVVSSGGPLAGLPFAVKDLFDIAGVVTLAGSKVRASNPPAERDATAVARLRAAGAVLVGATNMDEF